MGVCENGVANRKKFHHSFNMGVRLCLGVNIGSIKCREIRSGKHAVVKVETNSKY